jgi:hypothetical protein
VRLFLACVKESADIKRFELAMAAVGEKLVKNTSEVYEGKAAIEARLGESLAGSRIYLG